MTVKKGTRVVNPRFAKSPEYKAVIGAIADTKLCPFCPENFRYHKHPILKKGRGWILTENSWPYKNTQKHFIIISLKHKEKLVQLSTSDIKEILELSKWAVKKFDLKGGALNMRFGDTDYTGATVAHLHAHLISPQLNKKGIAETVNFPIG
ncbi:MAG: HIT domain-containing protein [Candidatus Adlerbacteria bacterium]